jgi:hypothetical protein
VPLEPRTLARTGKPDREHDNAFGRTWRGRGNRGSAGRSLGFGFGNFECSFFGTLFNQLTRLNRNYAFRNGWTEGLSDCLLATASTSTASATTAASAATLSLCGRSWLARLL